MQVQVNPKGQPFIEAKVASGEFASADAVVDAAIEHLIDEQASDLELCNRDVGPRLTVEQLKSLIEEGVADAGRFEPFDVEDVKRRGRERLAARGTPTE